ncbi:serpentine type 7TM GPCR chemoreceptor srsx domain-containing protein [Ditylenchus destructor]|uniref:Serpentine type 7TM GPCR chemoreceptor srsx domain-containing protein n=1 Tax=Ditylenchus destructor TaxID=166010 RepID=A0AAD4NFN7_9BILA|nr:serpentine type 7TM GPCR chemoreceptor srsx domain-containing protein [Ditylenchus destructor]
MAIIAMCWTYSLYIVYATFRVDFERYPNKRVSCQVADLYLDEVDRMVALNNIILNLSTLACYVGVWLLIKRMKREVSNRFFKSLTAIMISVTFGWFLHSISTVLSNLFIFSYTTQWYLTLATGVLMSAADASHAPILYIFSNQYKQAFREQIIHIAVLFRLREKQESSALFHCHT